ncbi:MAG TPA: hypothetical protein VFD30_07980 [Terriglobia bacterium]|nr:hypothetical protein [Terriglobia bacterium]
MGRVVAWSGALLLFLGVAGLAAAGQKQPNSGKLSGTWDCIAHGSSQGDIPFTLYLEQNKDDVTGSFTSPAGSTEINWGSFKKNILELQIGFHPIGSAGATYTLTGRLKKGQLTGSWSSDTEKGTWEGKRAVAKAGQ